MAQIRVLCWNIEVYGPEKYAISPNNIPVASLACGVIVDSGANIILLQELMSSVADGIVMSMVAHLNTLPPVNQWAGFAVQARPDGDRESYGFIYKTTLPFAAIAAAEGLLANEFPNNFSVRNGRKPAFKTFRTTDTNQNFAVTVYHAPPNNYAIIGVEALAEANELYQVNNGGVVQAVPARLLGGDYNMDVVVDAANYLPLTNPVPANPPPDIGAGEGAGCTASNAGGALAASTLLGKLEDAITAWGIDITTWPAGTTDYRRPSFAIDNIFHTGVANAAAVFDVISSIRNGAATGPIRASANAFARTKADGSEAFPNALNFPTAMNVALNTTGWAFLLYRYAVSDHLPVVVDVTI